jgi:hypothetical protein
MGRSRAAPRRCRGVTNSVCFLLLKAKSETIYAVTKKMRKIIIFVRPTEKKIIFIKKNVTNSKAKNIFIEF